MEAITSTAVGFGLSFVTWAIVGPLLGYHVTHTDNLAITAIFTAVSLIRGYAIRRLFNAIRR